MKPAARRGRGTLPLLVGLAFSGIFLWLALRDTDFESWSSALAEADFTLLIPFLLLLAGFYWLKAVRWAILLDPICRTRAGTVLPALMVGFAGNNLLPAHLGELVRVYLLGRQLEISPSAVLGSVVLERVLDLLSVLALLALALVYLPPIGDGLRYSGYAIAAVGLGLFAGTLLAVFRSGLVLRWLSVCSRVLPARWQQPLYREAERVIQGLSAIRNRELWLGLALTSLAQWIMLAVCIDLSLRALSLSLPWNASVLILALIVAGLTVPHSPGFFGTIELCFALGLAVFGTDPNRAFAAAIYYHLAAYVAVTGTGLVYLGRFGLGLGRVRRDAERLAQDTDD